MFRPGPAMGIHPCVCDCSGARSGDIAIKNQHDGAICCSRVEAGLVTPVITGPAGDFASTGAMAATGDSGNNPNTDTTGPNSRAEPPWSSPTKFQFLHNEFSRRLYLPRSSRAKNLRLVISPFQEIYPAPPEKPAISAPRRCIINYQGSIVIMPEFWRHITSPRFRC